MKTTITILALLLLISCGPNYYLKRSKKLEEKAIRLGAVVKTDTVYKYFNIHIPEVRTDTLFTSKPGDTVYITKDRLKIKYVKLPGDSVFIKGECEDSIITIKQPVYINKEIKAENKMPWWVYLIGGVMLLVITLQAIKR